MTDFGLAKAEENDDLTATGDFVGTLRYMAPERFRGKTDARSDVYSLGVTLYELATLRPAFLSSDRAPLMREVLDATPPSPRSVDPLIPRDLETIIQKAMAKEPERRYSTARALADDLRRFLAGEPIIARPISRLEHAVRKCQKYPGMTAALSSLVILGVVSFIAIVWQWRVAVTALKGEAVARKYAESRGRQAAESQRAAQISLHFHRVNLAHKEWLAGNVGRADQLLACQPVPAALLHMGAAAIAVSGAQWPRLGADR